MKYFVGNDHLSHPNGKFGTSSSSKWDFEIRGYVRYFPREGIDVHSLLPPHHLHPGRLTRNLRIHLWKRKIIFQTIMFRFYVNLRGCNRSKPLPTHENPNADRNGSVSDGGELDSTAATFLVPKEVEPSPSEAWLFVMTGVVVVDFPSLKVGWVYPQI